VRQVKTLVLVDGVVRNLPNETFDERSPDCQPHDDRSA
jgi:hypothetical protein